jgi:hypothetical protein
MVRSPWGVCRNSTRRRLDSAKTIGNAGMSVKQPRKRIGGIQYKITETAGVNPLTDEVGSKRGPDQLHQHSHPAFLSSPRCEEWPTPYTLLT